MIVVRFFVVSAMFALAGAVLGAAITIVSSVMSEPAMMNDLAWRHDVGFMACLGAIFGTPLGVVAGWPLRLGRVPVARAIAACFLGSLAGMAIGMAFPGETGSNYGFPVGLVAAVAIAIVVTRWGPPVTLRNAVILWIAAAALTGAVSVWSGERAGRVANRRALADMLNLSVVPATVDDLACRAWGWTDTEVTCALAVDPARFDSLLAGWKFRTTECGPNDRDGGPGPRVGPAFPIERCYRASAEEYGRGGLVQLWTDGSRSRVLVHLHIE